MGNGIHSSLMLSGIDLTFIIIIALVIIGLAIWFSATCYTTMTKIPEPKRVFPAWLCWLMLIPVAGYIFSWIMLPFGIPKSGCAAVPNNPDMERRAKVLFWLGIAYLVLTFFAIFLHSAGIPFLSIITFVLWIIYWVMLPGFRRLLDQAKQHNDTSET